MWKFFQDKALKNNIFALSFIVSVMVIMFQGAYFRANSQTAEVTPVNQTLTNAAGNPSTAEITAAMTGKASEEIKTAAAIGTIETAVKQSISEVQVSKTDETALTQQASNETNTLTAQPTVTATLENKITPAAVIQTPSTSENKIISTTQANVTPIETKENKIISAGTTDKLKQTPAETAKAAEAETQSFFKFKNERLIILIALIILAGIVLISINIASNGKDYFIRRIGGLNAIDEAIGRCTEMGKPVLYITGLSDMSAISTIASISILSYVAKKTAEYETSLLVPCCRSLVMNTAREVVKESYLEAGRPDSYNSENIKYLTDDQFGFVSGVDGIMLREKPAANFYLGHFMAESLIYAETGNSIGAIQIAGTAEFSQIPFFVAACDYCLIGEELFAAGAYLSRKPKDVGTLRGQDICKLAIMATIIIGVIIETIILQKPELAASLGFFKQLFISK